MRQFWIPIVNMNFSPDGKWISLQFKCAPILNHPETVHVFADSFLMKFVPFPKTALHRCPLSLIMRFFPRGKLLFLPLFFCRYINPGPITKSILQQYDDELDNPYFRRKPTSFLAGSGGGGGGPAMVTGSSATLPGTGIGAGAGGDSRRCTWMPMDDDAVRIEGPR